MPSKLRLWTALLAFGLIGLALIALLRAPPTGAPDEVAPLGVHFSGCRHLLGPLDDPTCVVAPHKPLLLWIPTGGPVEISIDGAPWSTAEPESRADGSFLRLELPPTPRHLAVRAGDEGRPPWRLQLLDDPARGEKSRFKDTFKDRLGSAVDQSMVEEALAAMADELEGALDPAVRGYVASTLGRYHFQTGHNAAASEHLRRAILEHRSWRDVKGEVNDSTLLFRVLFYELEQVDDAGALLDALPEAAAGYMDSEYLLHYARGSFARRTGDVRGALGRLGAAAELARRFGHSKWRIQSEQLLGLLLADLGQYDKAEALLNALLSEVDGEADCEAAHLRNAVAWKRLLSREAGRATADPMPLLRQAADEFRAHHCQQEERLNVELNLALGHWQNGDVEQAASHLRAATELTERPQLRSLLWWRELQARVALSRGHRREAAELYRDLAELARQLSAPNAAWRAAVGEARALRADGRLERALDAYADAEAQLDDAVRRVPVHVGRARSQAVRQAGVHEYLDLLLEQGRDELALRVARRARARAAHGLATRARLAELSPEERRRWTAAVLEFQVELRALDEALAESWRLPADLLAEAALHRRRSREQLVHLLDDAFSVLDRGRPAATELATLRPDELVLLYHPLGDGWVGFAADPTGVRSRRLGAIDPKVQPAELANRLLEPFRGELEESVRLRILASGALEDVDFHALPWDGEVLLAGRAVVYGLDMPSLGDSAGARLDPAPPTALLVADPTATLAGAGGLEVPRIGTLLKESEAWRVESLDRATASQLRSRLAGPALFHFAGHAVLRGRTESYLQLADRSRLGLGEVLTLDQVPAEVVLSACRGALPESGENGSGLSLAQAFVLAGADTVVAAVRPVDDIATSRLMTELYAQRLRHPTLAQALHSAQRRLYREAPHGEWSSFRLLER
ncbi:MAG: CHAT domain-containing protein [Acidobacteriota bacterium]